MIEHIQIIVTGAIPVNEAVTPNEDGSYTIFINDALGPEGRLAAYKHAISHIENHDFDKSDVDAIEAEAHNYS